MWEAAALAARGRLVLRLASTAVLAAALLMPAVARSDGEHKGLKSPTALAVADTTPTSLTLTWSPGHGRPAQGYALFRDGHGVASTAETSHTFTGLSCGRVYTLAIEAFDSAGNRSEPASVTAATNACPAPPPSPAPPSPPNPQPPNKSNPPAPTGPALPPAPAPKAPSALPAPTGVSEMSWSGAGAFIWHETDVAPEALGAQLRENGFSWAAVLVHDGMAVDPIEGDWVRRFRAASGLPVGGWGVLRTEPEREADLAHGLLDHYALDFYIANAEAEYKLSSDDGRSAERFGRSQRFAARFRALEPGMPAAVSSYCRADRQNIDWKAWRHAGFAFLPQAYVNDFGTAASPASCVEGAAAFFESDVVHPTVGMYTGGQGEAPSPGRYAALLDEAGTVGFSVYLAETLHPRDWQGFGEAIATLGISRVVAGTEPKKRLGPPAA